MTSGLKLRLQAFSASSGSSPSDGHEVSTARKRSRLACLAASIVVPSSR
ncbi:MAG: hypothetical protein R3F53_05745 [Gammaproteobacteria bacterium]